MKTLHASLFCLVFLSAASESLRAQTPPAPNSDFAGDRSASPMFEVQPAKLAARAAANTISNTARTKLYHDVDPDGALWCRGANFKLRMDSSGTDFVPFLGSRAPHDFPVQLALAGATVAGDPLAIDCAAAPARRGDVVTFDRGVIDEVYEIGLDQVEQKFVVAGLPSSGELALRVAVDTELHGSASDAGFEFANEFGTVRCGTATAIDARGHTLALASEFADGVMTMRVPADFIAEAAFPLVIDPLWFTVDLENGFLMTLSPDAAHPIGPYLFVCWEEIYSANDHDVFGELITGGGAVYSNFYLDHTYANWVRPRAGHLSATDSVLVAAERDYMGSGKTIWGRVVAVGQPSAPTVGPQTEISALNTPGDKRHPEVGGDPYPANPSYFCVVYEHELTSTDHDIEAQLLDGVGMRYGGSLLIGGGSGVSIESAPAISKTDDATAWNIVWEHEITPIKHDIYGARLYWDGNPASATFQLPSVWTDQSNPTVSGPIQGTNRYMIAWEQECLIYQGCDRDIVASFVDGTTVMQTSLLPYSLQDETAPALEGNGRHFVCAFEQVNSLGGKDLVGTELLPFANSFQLGETVALAATGFDDVTPRLVNHEDSDQGGFSTLSFALWARGSDIVLDAYQCPEGGTFQYFCQQWPDGVNLCPCGQNLGWGGCPNSSHQNGAVLVPSGIASTANDTVTFDFGDLPPNVSCLMFEGTSTAAATFGDGMRCIGTPTIRFPLRTANGAGATGYGASYGDTPVSVRGGVPSLGGVFLYQVWYRDPANFCTPATTNLTNGVRVIWTP